MVAELDLLHLYFTTFTASITNLNMELNKQQSSFEQLINSIYQTHCVLQENAQRIINQNLTIRNWLVGYYIVEFEQNGKDRAKYGEKLIDEMAKMLQQRNIKGFSPMTLRSCRTFYNTYPQIQQTVSVKLQSVGVKSLFDNEIPIQQTVIGELMNEPVISSELLLSKLSYSHFIELIRVGEPLERLFYEVESIKNNWSVRELKRAIDTSLALRTTLSINKESVIAKIKNLKPERNIDIIKNPYLLEFLGLEEKNEYTESDLEQAILTHLQKFLVELGTGFCFEARQKRITFDNTHYRIDLVFYHRILKCHVLVDLKIGEFTHADAGQMTLYLNYFKTEEMTEGDNPPIGIILCADKNDTLVKYTTANMEDQLFVSKYLLKMPDKKALENIVREGLER